MGWWSRFMSPRDELPYALTAAARAVEQSRVRLTPTYETWQEELWGYYDELGEFRFAVGWKAEMMSRVRLRAGRIIPGRDEPEFVDTGLPAELISEFGGDIGGQSEIMDSLTTQLDVCGDSYVVGETKGQENNWIVRSVDEIRRTSLGNGDTGWEIVDDDLSDNGRIVWRKLSGNYFVTRVWRPHKRRRHMADTPARAARGTMRELELVNRHIQAQYLSRLASAGVLVLPDDVSFPVREEFQDANDPFVAEWIDTARQAIKEQGTASAVVPIPMRVPADVVDKIRHIDFTLKFDDKIVEKRESAIRRLSSQVDVPPEILLGMSGLNHWAAWQVEESAIKTHISPLAEIICHALTIGYLHPRLRAAGVDPTGIVVWYDTSELIFRPDRSDNAVKVYDRGELDGKALRRETGFDESDKPSNDELEAIGLKMLMKNPQVGFLALEYLTGLKPPAAPETTGDEDPNRDETVRDTKPDDEADGAPPGNQDDAPDREVKVPKRTARIAEQAVAMHRFVVNVDSWTLYHPPVCDGDEMHCPVAQASRYTVYHPGKSGAYECWLSPTGEMVLGSQVFDVTPDRFTQGHTRKFKRRSLANGKRR